MMKTIAYKSLDKVELRKKGWKIFGIVVSIQLVFLVFGYTF